MHLSGLTHVTVQVVEPYLVLLDVQLRHTIFLKDWLLLLGSSRILDYVLLMADFT